MVLQAETTLATAMALKVSDATVMMAVKLASAVLGEVLL